MQVRVFTIPMESDGIESLEELNAFLRSQKVLSVSKVPVVDGGRHYWSLCIEYLPHRTAEAPAAGARPGFDASRPRIDYRELLSRDEFERFVRLRTLRKELAEAEAVPVYTILTNSQLADIARTVPLSRAALAAIEGMGPAKLERYADSFLALLRTLPLPAIAPPAVGEVASTSNHVPEPSAAAVLPPHIPSHA